MTMIDASAAVGADSQSTFRSLTIERVSNLRSALILLFNATGLNVRKSKDLQTHYGIDYTFSWRLYRLLSDDDVLSHCVDIPTLGMMQRLYSIAEEKRAPHKLIRGVQDAFDAFESHVAHYAGDRDFFMVMVAQAVGGEQIIQAEMAHRKAGYEMNRFFLGTEADLLHATDVFHGDPKRPGAFDSLHFQRYAGLRRVHANRPLEIGTEHYTSTVDGRRVLTVGEPIDKESYDKYGISILAQFCSDPNLPLKSKISAKKITTVWQSESVGRPSAVDIVKGRILRSQPRRVLRPGYGFSDPLRLFIQDMLVHRPTVGRIEPKSTRWYHIGDHDTVLSGYDAEHFMDAGFMELPCREQLTFVGSGEGAAYTPDSPQHIEILQYSCKKMGWNLNDFDVYRLRMEYPLLQSLIFSSADVPQQM